MTARPHILFVDDDASVLAGLRRNLRSQRDRWDTTFVAGAEDALAVLRDQPTAVLVTDFQMPGMDGGALLQIVRERYPRTARVVLSGHTDETDLLRVVLLAHQFVHKPCQQQDLVAAIDRVLALRPTLDNEEVQRQIAGIDTLPSPPSTLRRLLAVLESDRAVPASVGRVLEEDPAAAAKVLQVVNSSASPVGRKISDLGQAVALLGMRNVRALVMMHDLVRNFEASETIPHDWAELHNRHSVQTSRLARRLAGRNPWADDAFAAGLLLDVGGLVLALCRPDAFVQHRAAWADGDGPLSPIEIAAFGVDHAAVGAYLLGLWGLPLAVIAAVSLHSRPGPGFGPSGVASTVALAHAVVEAELGPICGRRDGVSAVDESRLAPHQLTCIDEWRTELAEAADRAAR